MRQRGGKATTKEKEGKEEHEEGKGWNRPGFKGETQTPPSKREDKRNQEKEKRKIEKSDSTQVRLGGRDTTRGSTEQRVVTMSSTGLCSVDAFFRLRPIRHATVLLPLSLPPVATAAAAASSHLKPVCRGEGAEKQKLPHTPIFMKFYTTHPDMTKLLSAHNPDEVLDKAESCNYGTAFLFSSHS